LLTYRSSRAPSSNWKKGKGELGRGRRGRDRGKERESVGRREMGKRREKEGAGEGREHQLIFAIVCDTALPKCWI